MPPVECPAKTTFGNAIAGQVHQPYGTRQVERRRQFLETFRTYSRATGEKQPVEEARLPASAA